jgi:hypothetical protein
MRIRVSNAAGRGGRAAMAAAVVALLMACSRADSQRVGTTETASHTAGSGGVITAASQPYRVDRSIAGGRISGSVSFDGAPPSDSTVHPTVDAAICGQTIVPVTVVHRGPRLTNAVVWLDGVAAGKPIPLVRRYDLTTEGCQLLPRVQTAIAGGTLDVRSDDQVTHLTRFIQHGTSNVLATIPETEAGAVVPSRTALAASGLVEVRCDVHPWSQAWIAVFDQPYFAMSDANGSFAIDSVPPGRYRITVWHERFGTQTDSVTVVAGGTAVVDLKFGNR